MSDYNDNRTVITLSKNHFAAIKKIKEKTKVPMRYIIEEAIEEYLGKKYPDVLKKLRLKEARNEKEND